MGRMSPWKVKLRLTLPFSRILRPMNLLLRNLKKMTLLTPWNKTLTITSTLKRRNQKLLVLNLIMLPFMTPMRKMQLRVVSPFSQALFMMKYP